MSETEIERELIAAQAGMAEAAQARLRRKEAVMRAIAAGWSKYRIAGVLGVRGPTVDSIIASAGREPHA